MDTQLEVRAGLASKSISPVERLYAMGSPPETNQQTLLDNSRIGCAVAYRLALRFFVVSHQVRFVKVGVAYAKLQQISMRLWLAEW